MPHQINLIILLIEKFLLVNILNDQNFNSSIHQNYAREAYNCTVFFPFTGPHASSGCEIQASSKENINEN